MNFTLLELSLGVAHREKLSDFDLVGVIEAISNPKLSLAEMFDILATECYNRHHPEARAKRAKERAKRRASLPHEKNEEPSISFSADPKSMALTDDSPSSVPIADLPEKFAVPKSIDARKRTLPESLFYELIIRDGFRCSHQDPMTHIRCHSLFKITSNLRGPRRPPNSGTTPNPQKSGTTSFHTPKCVPRLCRYSCLFHTIIGRDSKPTSTNVPDSRLKN